MLDWIGQLLTKARPRLSRTKPSRWSDRTWSRLLQTGAVPGDDGSITVDQLMRSGAVVACSGLIADALASAPLGVVEQSRTGGLREVRQGDAAAMLAMLTFDDCSAAIFGCAATGNGFWRIVEGRLHALDSLRTTAYVDPAGRVFLKQGGDAYLPYDEAVHARWRYEPGFVLGYSPVQIAADSTGASLAFLRMATAYANNAASPGNILAIPGFIPNDKLKEVRAAWEDSVAGFKQDKTAVLEGGLEYKRVDPPPATDADLINALKWSVADIARIYGVPGSLVGLTEDVNKATAAEQSRQFYTTCLKPWSARIGGALSARLLTDAERQRGLSVAFDLSDAALGFGEERARYLRELVNSGIVTSNEARNSLGYADVPGADKLRAQVNMTTLDKLGNSDGNAATE